jgi:hypothetical protein
MDDEELRAEFARLLEPVQRMPVPAILGLRRRVRRRRAGQAAASTVVCACAAVAAGLFFGPSGTPSSVVGTGRAAGCASSDLVIKWLPPAGVKGIWAEAPPETYLLELRNVGTTTCSLKGWPRPLVTGLSRPGSVTVTYQTHFDEWVGTFRTRTVRVTRMILQPGAAAVAVVNVGVPIAVQNGCVTRAWLVRPPAPGDAPVRSRGDLPQLCDGSYLTESPLYPPNVPITKDYPLHSAHPVTPAS